MLHEEYAYNQPQCVRTKGFYIYLNPRDAVSYQIFRAGIWEPRETKLLEKLVTRKSSVVDVGANIGWFTLCSATKARVVHAFEPEPTDLLDIAESPTDYWARRSGLAWQ